MIPKGARARVVYGGRGIRLRGIAPPGDHSLHHTKRTTQAITEEIYCQHTARPKVVDTRSDGMILTSIASKLRKVPKIVDSRRETMRWEEYY